MARMTETQERALARVAEAIYTAVDGSDNKAQHEAMVDEIMRWLEDGCRLTGTERIEWLVEEWNEYVAESIMEDDAE